MRYRHLRRTIIAVLAATAFVLVAGLVVVKILQTDTVRGWTRTWIEQIASQQLNARVTIGELSWGTLPPRVLLHRVTAEVAGMQTTVDRLSIDLRDVYVLERTLELGTVAADGVRLRLEGMPERSSPGDGWLRLRVRQLELRRIELDGTNLGGSIRGLTLGGASLAWTTEQRTPRGFLAVDSLRLEVAGLDPVETQLSARFSAGQSLAVPRWQVRNPHYELSGSGGYDPQGGWTLDGSGFFAAEELDRVVRAGNILDGRCQISFTLKGIGEELLDAALSSPRIEVEGFVVEDLAARVKIRDSQLYGEVDQAVYNGGRLRGSYHLGTLGPPFAHHLRTWGSGVQLAGVLDDLGVPPAGLSARADLEVELGWSSDDIDEGSGHGTARLTPGPGAVPVDGQLSARLSPDGLLHFAAADLRIASSTLRWQGPLTVGSWIPAWSMQLSPAVLDELVPVVNTWIGTDALPAEIRGPGELQITLDGPWQQLQAGIRLEASPLIYPPFVFDRVVAEGEVRDGTLHVNSARYRISDGDGELAGTLSWRDRPSCGFTTRGQAIPLATLASWIGIYDGVAGSVTFSGGFRGDLQRPRGSWAMVLHDMNIAGQDLGRGTSTVDLEEGTFRARRLSFDSGLEGTLRWDVWASELSSRLRWPAMPLALLGERTTELIGDTAQVEADLSLGATGVVTGTLRASTEHADLEIEAGHENVTVAADLGEAAMASATLQHTAGGGLAGIGSARIVDLEQLLDRLLPERGVPLSGGGSVDFDLTWPSGGMPELHGRLVSLDMELEQRPAHLVEPAEFSLSPEGIEVGGLLLSLLDDEVFVRGAIDADGSLSGNLSGTVDALLLRFLLPEWEPAGQATAVVELLGSLEQPQLEGIARLSEVSFRVPGTRHVVSDIDGTVLLSADEAQLEGVDFRLMHGTARCSGSITLRDGTPELILTGTVADLEYPLFTGLAPRLRGTWQLEGRPDALLLAGDLQIDHAVLRRKDDIVTILLDWFGDSAPPTTGEVLALDLRVQADSTLEARTPFLSLTGSAALHVTGTAASPGLAGNIEFEEGGDLSFQGVRYEIERASLTFSDPARIEPFVDMQARSWVESYQVTVRLTGPSDRLVPVLSSDPPLPESSIVSLLALGFRDESGAGETMGVGFASTLLTREINAEIERRARMLLPVDQLRVDPFAEYATGNPAARVTVVKQVSPSWTVILQSNLSSNREEVVVSRWYLAPGLFIEATRDVDGSYAMDLKLRRSY